MKSKAVDQHLQQSLPTTQRTWIGELLRNGEEERLQNFLMAVYYEPLVHAAQTLWKMPEHEVHAYMSDFLMNHLLKADYLHRWQAHGIRLRHWLWKGLSLSRRETHRWLCRFPRVGELPDVVDHQAPAPPIEFERGFVRSLVRTATRMAAQECRETSGGRFALHAEMFEHFAEGATLAALERRYRLKKDHARLRLRPPFRRFVDALTALLVADGVRREAVPRAIQELLAFEG